MAKVITFSTVFPAYHPKKGRPTFFVQNFWRSIGFFPIPEPKLSQYAKDLMLFKDAINLGTEKHHTIRSGKRFKAGDYFSPRIWSGKPYNSKQIILAPDVKIKKVWEIEMFEAHPMGQKTFPTTFINNKQVRDTLMEAELAQNDGLYVGDLEDWFTKSPEFKKTKRFSGQIICWNAAIKY